MMIIKSNPKPSRRLNQKPKFLIRHNAIIHNKQYVIACKFFVPSCLQSEKTEPKNNREEY